MSEAAPTGPAVDLGLVERPMAPLGVRVGRVTEVDAKGAPMIDFPGNPNGAVLARVALNASDAVALASDWQRLPVLIVFADQDLRQPIISGIVSETLICAATRDEPGAEPERQIRIESEDELVLQCGMAKIMLRSDGKICIVGREIVSRARESHRIKGATVAIN